jgi:periplasmic copper chaperone A
MKTPLRIAIIAAAIMGSSLTFAQTVTIESPWVRATVPGQTGTGGFMRITSAEGARLVGVASPVAAIGEVHEMKMQDGVMRMAALPKGLELPKGQAVELKPGGLHLMLLDLKTTLLRDTTIPVTLSFVGADGKAFKREITVPISTRAPVAAGAASAAASASASAPMGAVRHDGAHGGVHKH